MSGIIVSANASLDPTTGKLAVRGTAVATGGGVASIAVLATESLATAGAGTSSVPADGNSYDWEADIAPAIAGPWTSGGTGLAAAVLFDQNGAQIATGQQIISIY